ncbi:MAG: folD [Anaerosporomusa subterranea]|jgi:methylenetetrahydrofolate dehydrogenase (NADP+)/methenyltetrahydrofolate cyclohydrolase|nr:folD [Anaerosporomusa subterranea]
MAIILAGAPVAAARRDAIRAHAESLRRNGVVPCLAIVLVGDDAASQVYSQRLQKLGASVGVNVILEKLPQTALAIEVVTVIERLNADSDIHAILPMMPLPRQIDANLVVEQLSPLKDADSLHPLNAGLVATGKSAWAPCTPRAVMAILAHYQIPLAGRHAVLVGRSNVVGKPLANLLLAEDATVTICHSKTTDLAKVIKQGDIVIAAVGRPKLIQADMIKQGAVVVDVGINETDEGLVGDVDYLAVEQVAAAITPVPGGVGTVSSVMVMEAVLNRWLKDDPNA